MMEDEQPNQKEDVSESEAQTKDEQEVNEAENNGSRISNDIADYVLVKCQVCGIKKTMTTLRAHTKAAHKLTITEYKEKFGQLEPIESVFHQCGICSVLIMFDSDHIASHLKSPGHNITHKEYNSNYLTDSRDVKQGGIKGWLARKKEKREKMEQTTIKCKTEAQENKMLGNEVKQEPDLNDIVKEECEDECDSKEDAKPRPRRCRDRNLSFIDYDEEIAFEKAIKASLKAMKKEDRLKQDIDIIDMDEKPKVRVDIKFDNSSLVTSTSVRPESEEVEKHIQRHQLGDKLFKICKVCGYSTDR